MLKFNKSFVPNCLPFPNFSHYLSDLSSFSIWRFWVWKFPHYGSLQDPWHACFSVGIASLSLYANPKSRAATSTRSIPKLLFSGSIVIVDFAHIPRQRTAIYHTVVGHQQNLAINTLVGPTPTPWRITEVKKSLWPPLGRVNTHMWYGKQRGMYIYNPTVHLDIEVNGQHVQTELKACSSTDWVMKPFVLKSSKPSSNEFYDNRRIMS